MARIRGRKFHIFLDANGGAGGPLGRRLLEDFACRSVCHGCSADGLFQHEPEPILENLRAICPLVAEHRADVGFVLDPDADRLALIDETGRYLGEELTLALAVLFCGAARGAAPSYSAAGIVSTASYAPGPFASNTLITVFGAGLARSVVLDLVVVRCGSDSRQIDTQRVAAARA